MPFQLDQLPDRQFIVRFTSAADPRDESTFCVTGFGQQGRVNAELILAALEALEEIAGQTSACPRCDGMIDTAKKAQRGERVKKHE
ncbi:MAG TPA: hypothetical protein VK797_23355 [Tepidisphaeraceae bacterium]|jgi:hypothetical protein|nr:hypothetical protein [Tepidisphaeraceae bacterium]